MKVLVCLLMLTATWLRADIQTVTASAVYADQYGGTFGGASYALSAQLAGFDASLGVLDSVDLTVTAVSQTALHWGTNNYTGPYPFSGTIGYSQVGTASYFPSKSVSQTVSVYVQSPICHVPYCSIAPILRFGGEQVFTDSGTLAQFKAGSIPIQATATVASGSGAPASPMTWCCETFVNLWLADQFGRPYEVAGYLTLDVTAAYTYTPLDPAPEPSTKLWLLLALPLMTAVSRWLKRKA